MPSFLIIAATLSAALNCDSTSQEPTTYLAYIAGYSKPMGAFVFTPLKPDMTTQPFQISFDGGQLHKATTIGQYNLSSGEIYFAVSYNPYVLRTYTLHLKKANERWQGTIRYSSDTGPDETQQISLVPDTRSNKPVNASGGRRVFRWRRQNAAAALP